VLAFLPRRLLFGAGSRILTTCLAYGTMRFLRPEQYPGQATVADLFADVERARRAVVRVAAPRPPRPPRRSGSRRCSTARRST
jgi:hypothetical protein